MASQHTAQAVSLPGKLLLAFLGLAHAPVLLVYFRQLWAREHYQFFPFAILALVVLYRTRWEVPLRRWSVWCSLLVVADCVLLASAIYLQSTFIAIVAVGCLVSAVAISTPDQASRFSLAYLIPLFILIVRPPLGLDERLVNGMQHRTTNVASRVLDGLGYVHHRAGNVIQLPDKDLLLEEACSGVQSLFTILFIGVFVSVYHRRSLTHLLLLTALSAAWAFGFNVLRVICIAVAWDQWQIDLAVGTAHTVVGYTFLLAAIGMLFSTDGLVRLFIAPIEQAADNSIGEHNGYSSGYEDDVDDSGGYRNIFIDAWNSFTSPLAVHATSPRLRQVLRWNPRTPDLVWLIPAIIVTVGLCAIQIPQVMGQPTRSKTRASESSLLDQTALPDKLGPFQLDKYRIEHRGPSHTFGDYSNIWQYARANGTSVHVGCDHAFSSWHDLEVCYTGLGWEVETRRVIAKQTDWPIVEVFFSKPTGERAWLVYCFFTSEGERVIPANASVGASLIDRLRKTTANSNDQLHQVQLFAEVPERLPDAVREQLLQVHRESREAMRAAFLQGREGASNE